MSQQNLTIFENQWQVYQQVVECNFMSHQQIQESLHDVLSNITRSFSLLDLGCGDAFVMFQALSNTQVASYCGVDLSKAALGFAKKNAHAMQINTDFSVGDLKDFNTVIADKHFDIIVAGFSLHHLQADEKQQFFHDCKERLNKHGTLIVYDAIRRHEENRDTYLARYCNNIESNWDGLSEEAIALIFEHIMSSDYPQSLQELKAMTKQANFEAINLVYKDDSEFHQLLLID